MAKKKAPARKGGTKNAAPKQGAKKVVVVQKGRRQGLSTAAAAAAAIEELANPGPSHFLDHAGKASSGSGEPIEMRTELSKHPTVEEQFAADYAAETARRAPKPSMWSRFRSAITGLFVSKKFADANPDTTVRERGK